MIRLSPSFRISLGLASIALGVVLLGNMSGLLPDKAAVEIMGRKQAAESMALQCTLAAKKYDIKTLGQLITSLKMMYPEVLSTGLLGTDGKYLFQSPEHPQLWLPTEVTGSTETLWRVPIFEDDKEWATLEICFAPLNGLTLFGYRLSSFALLFSAFFLLCFVIFYLYMARVLRAIDPTSVMPSRVKHAFDTLSEGLILVDDKERIVMANAAIARRLQCKEESLLGMKASRLQWHGSKSFDQSVYFPWQEAIDTGHMIYGFPMAISPDGKEERIFMVNSAPIVDGNGRTQGALTTFDDVTELERKNIQLAETIGQLELSHEKVQLQNVELERLATRDPMTGCFNRRAFFSKAEELFTTAKVQGTKLACVMTDIDKFKLVNDTYGHGVGDQVIKYYAKILQMTLRSDDLLCRYGGEEFCILLPTCDVDAAALVAEKARERIRNQSGIAVEEEPDIYIAGSFGVSSILDGANRLDELIDQADKALYAAKETGRNKVACYEKSMQI